MASVGINGCSINNVNADVRVISAELLPEVARVADVFRPWGVKLFLSLDFASPRKIGGIEHVRSARPGGRRVLEAARSTKSTRRFPTSAASCSRPTPKAGSGPREYGRTHADAANVIAQALEPHGGILFYRGFVYDHKMDWRNPKNDRARAAYDNFHPLDGKFDDNVIIQIKHGPIDFQVREPASPLFGGLQKTNQAIELQITQEYLGQQRHLCFLVPMWKEVLDFDMQANPEAKGDRNVTPVKELVAGQHVQAALRRVRRRLERRPRHQLARPPPGDGQPLRLRPARLESRSRQASRSPKSGRGSPSATIRRSSARSSTCCSSRGASTRTTPARSASARSPTSSTSTTAPASSRRRTTAGANGTAPTTRASAWTAPWPPAPASSASIRRPSPRVYESLETCPDELLLFMHHVPYTHVLHSGKTVIQHIYDSHYEGARDADRLVRNWKTLKGRIDEAALPRGARRPQLPGRPRPASGATRSATGSSASRASPTTRSASATIPNRIEAEAMELDGYEPQDVTPWETASGGQAAALTAKDQPRHDQPQVRPASPAGTTSTSPTSTRTTASRSSSCCVGDQLVDEWTADDTLPHDQPSGHTSTRHKTPSVALRPGDVIRLEATSDDGEQAGVDYLEITPAG